MQAAFAGLGLDDVAMLGAFFTRWLSHGSVLTNMDKGLAVMLTGLKDIADIKNDADYTEAALSNSSGQLNCCSTSSNLSISKKNNSRPGNRRMLAVAHYHVCVKALESHGIRCKELPCAAGVQR
jgi:hypothetical protein